MPVPTNLNNLGSVGQCPIDRTPSATDTFYSWEAQWTCWQMGARPMQKTLSLQVPLSPVTLSPACRSKDFTRQGDLYACQ